MDSLSLGWQAFILGTLQGLTEFLPISSSAHLIIIPFFFEWHNPLIDSLTFGVVVHGGTLLAILWYFSKDWWKLGQGFFRILATVKIQNFDEKLILYIILANIPAAITGFFLEKTVETTFRNPLLLCFPLVTVSLLMIYAEKRENPKLSLQRLKLADAMIIGLAQSLALWPGVSRSGITITTGLLLGFRREACAQFSFLLSTPIIGGAAFFHLRHFFFDERVVDWSILGIGFASSAIGGYLSIAFLMGYLKGHSLNLFAIYRLILAFIIISWMIIK